MPILSSVIKTAGFFGIAAGSTFLGLTSYKIYDLKHHSTIATGNKKPDNYQAKVPPRSKQITFLEDTPEYDILVIGGGATGTGIALDAATRGLKTALVEKGDFASQTSSKSTKLIHGGVRYLQAAILGFDFEQYRMICMLLADKTGLVGGIFWLKAGWVSVKVKEALRERSNFLTVAPHLTKALPILLPLRSWWDTPYMWVGIKLYDMVSGDTVLRHSYYLNRERTKDSFPQLDDEELSGGIVYFDGQQNDARMCLALATTAAKMGAHVANYVEVVNLVKGREGWKDFVRGAVVRDNISGKEFMIRAKCVINATGPFTDSIRKIDNAAVEPICEPSSGVHLALPDYFCPRDLGLINVKTSDGRVIFVLPWEDITLAGTTDLKSPVTFEPTPTEREIEFILKEVQKLLKLKLDRNHILSAWSGIRPLVRDPSRKDTKSLVRNHIIDVSPSHLITIAGGKWTTYRAMAEETVDRAIAECGLKPEFQYSQTLGFLLDGAHDYTAGFFVKLIDDFGVDHQVAKHLAHQYGDQSVEVLKLATLTGKAWPVIGLRLLEDYPYLEAEVRFACRSQYAVTATDIIARRTRLAFQDVDGARQALPRVIAIMGEELNWNDQEKLRQKEDALDFIDRQMGYKAVRSRPPTVARENLTTYLQRFKALQAAPGGGLTYKKVAALASELQLGDYNEEEIATVLQYIHSDHKNKLISEIEFLHLAAELRRIQERAADEEKKKHWPRQKGEKG